jgi:hypothetical protein
LDDDNKIRKKRRKNVCKKKERKKNNRIKMANLFLFIFCSVVRRLALLPLS